MGKRLVVFNVHFAPQSFGGGTIVTERCVEWLAQHGWDVLVVTTSPAVPPGCCMRYEAKGADVVAFGAHPGTSYESQYWNDAFAQQVAPVVDAFGPDAAHVQCIQNMGAALVPMLKSRGIPVVITMHDCWWFCERQFMIGREKRYCFNETGAVEACFDCADCVPLLEDRQARLRATAGAADALLFPSAYHMELHRAWGFPADKLRVNKNGVLPPGAGFERTTGAVLRFGFVGGPGPVKGADLIEAAFNELDETEYELKIVDAAKQLGGHSWASGFSSFDIPGTFELVAPYTNTTDGLDAFFGELDVLLFPSLCRESFGLTVREAMLRDVWVIATDGGGVVEDIADGVSGRIIPLEADPRHLADSLHECFRRREFILTYRNPDPDRITTCAHQAEDLEGILHEVIVASA